MTKLIKRYELSPQMLDYDKIGQKWLPYLMFFHSPFYSSQVLNTDAFGFRASWQNNQKIDNFQNLQDTEVSILIGDSFVFGVGASSDKTTINSILNSQTNDLWLNFGGRAFNTTQQFLLFSLFYSKFKKIKKVIIISGLNNLLLYYTSKNYPKDLNPFFLYSSFNSAMQKESFNPSFKRKLLKVFLYPFFQNKINYSKARFSEILDTIFKQKTIIERKENYTKEELLILPIKRDLKNWQIFAKHLNFELKFILQPMASWLKKEFSNEEKILFNELDNSPLNSFQDIEKKLNYEEYQWFKNELQNICKEINLPFYDLNELLAFEDIGNKWLFVDRAHFNSSGNEIIAKILKEKIL